MTRACQTCGKRLSAHCDYCKSLNVRRSRSKPDTWNCGNCFRKHMVMKSEPGLQCSECEIRRKRQTDRGGIT